MDGTSCAVFLGHVQKRADGKMFLGVRIHHINTYRVPGREYAGIPAGNT